MADSHAFERLPLSILFVSHDAWRTGAPMLLLHFLRWLKTHSDVNFTILLRDGAGGLRSEFERLAPVFAWNELATVAPAGGGPSPRERFIEHLHHTGVGLVYSNTITNGEILEALADTNWPVITHVHELEYWILHRVEKANIEQNRRHTSRFVAASRAVRDTLVNTLHIDAARVEVVYEFIPIVGDTRNSAAARIRNELRIPPTALIVGGSGTTDWRKAPDLFVQLAASVRRQRPSDPIHFLWVGGEHTGVHIEALRYDAARAGVLDRVHFVGQQAFPLDYFATFDLFAMISREDPFPLVALEAASLGKPILCFDRAGGMCEFVEDDAGVVVPYLDLQTMAGAVVKLAEDPVRRTELGARAAEKVRRQHDVHVGAAQLLEVIEQVTDAPPIAVRCLDPKPLDQPAHTLSESASTTAEYVPARDVRLIAFYLPQFHPIPENDAWWGRGFTEWTNVAAARPLFKDHAQPNLPSDLGFYDLRLPEVREAQARLAGEHGLHGFCYYHYWFNGRRLLERPFNEVLASGRPDFPFCLCWANENWTRAWDGLDREVLIAQQHGPDDDREHMRWLAPALRDRRYIRVDGKPLVIVYRISRLPNPGGTAEIWREEAQRLGVGDIVLAFIESLRDDRVDPAAVGFDAAIEFQPDWLNVGKPLAIVGDHNTVYSYETLIEHALAKPAPAHRQFRCVTTGWDNTPRRRTRAIVFSGSAPQLYEGWLERVIGEACRREREPIVFVNAWNEWAEGACLEPSQQWGRGYLEATRRAVHRTPTQWDRAGGVRAPAIRLESRPKVSVGIPAYNGARYLASAIQSVLSQSLEDVELIVVDDGSSDGTIEVARSFAGRGVRTYTNDAHLGLGANWNRCVELARGEYVTLFHQDDLMAPENLARKAAFLDEHPSAGFVHSNVLQIGPSGELISRWWYFEPTPADEGLHDGYEYFKTLLLGPNIICCPSVLVRRTCYDKVGRFNPGLPLTADWEMWLRACLFFDVGYLLEPLVSYRRHEDQETRRFEGRRDLEQAYLAKTLVLDALQSRIPDWTTLRPAVLEYYRDAALALCREQRARGEMSEAVHSVAFAIDVEGGRAASSRDYRDWLVGLAGELLDQRSPAIARQTARPVNGHHDALRRANDEIAALRASVSWRLTSPLRAAYEALLRMRARGAGRGL